MSIPTPHIEINDDLLRDLPNLWGAMTVDEQRLVEMLAGDPLWIPQDGPQLEACVSPATQIFYGGSAGGGKGLLPDELIATPYGYRKLRDLSVGDNILSRDGTITKVIGIYPQRKQPIYKVTFADGATLTTDGPHKWLYSTIQSHQWKIGTTKHLTERIREGAQLAIPTCEPLQFATNSAPITQAEELYNVGTALSSIDTPYAQGISVYKWASIEGRWALLQGLMDVGGSVGVDGILCYRTTDATLADDVKWVVTSLGGIATVERSSIRPGYTVHIQLPDNTKAFRLKEKKDRVEEQGGARGKIGRRIVSIEPVGEAETICLAVDHPESLFIAGKDLVVTHNTDLLIGIAAQQHYKSIILRRQFTLLSSIIERMRVLFPLEVKLNEQKHWWRFPNGRRIAFGHCEHEKSKFLYQGRPHDLYGFDEVTEFTKTQYEFITGWLRSTDPKQRKRIINTFNPPATAEGVWVIEMLAPWFDPKHPDPAESAEVRYFVRIGEEEIAAPNSDPIEEGGKIYYPEGRTFIRARLQDNAYYMYDTAYIARLQAMPEPYRSMLLEGVVRTDFQDSEFQVFPTEWVRLAMERGKGLKQPKIVTAVGVDVARGGRDRFVICCIHNNSVSLHTHPGSAAPDGDKGAALVIAYATPDIRIGVDDIGVGGSVLDSLRRQGYNAKGVNGASGSRKRIKGTRTKFINRRAEIFWRLREALDPTTGENLALPDDRELLRELTALTYKISTAGLQIEDKDSVKKRIGRSPDKADALAYAHAMTYIAPGIH